MKVQSKVLEETVSFTEDLYYCNVALAGTCQRV